MLRPYLPQDKQNLLTLLKLNTPRFFDPSEAADFADYLEHHREDYFVVELGENIVGCGGINYFPEAAVARLSWDVIHPDCQGQGIGRELVLYRMDRIKKNQAIKTILVRTTQLVYRFYEKMGFALEKIERDFWAPGFDLYQMQMTLSRNSH